MTGAWVSYNIPVAVGDPYVGMLSRLGLKSAPQHLPGSGWYMEDPYSAVVRVMFHINPSWTQAKYNVYDILPPQYRGETHIPMSYIISNGVLDIRIYKTLTKNVT